jgi:hypothetical protein
MEKFRLPRKLKKRLKKGLWLYPNDENGNSLMANPHRSKKDFQAYKKGVLENLIDDANSRKRRKEYRRKMNKEVIVPDEELKKYVDDIFRKEVRRSSYETLLSAKNNSRAIIAYYNFINAYQLMEQGQGSYGNTCCMSVDLAKDLLKKG